MRKMAMTVAAVIPPMTADPMTCRETAPPAGDRQWHAAEDEAKEVIRIVAAVASPPPASLHQGRPFSYSILANSTIRMAFLAARRSA